VEDDVRPQLLEQVDQRLAVAYVGLDEATAVRKRLLDIRAPAGREVIDDHDAVAAREKSVDDVRPDEPCASCDHGFHAAGDGSVGAVAGLFVTIEGIDRSGKSTQARRLAEALADDALLVREPGGTPAGERIRDLLKDPAIELDPRSEALLFAAARAELVAAVIVPALEAGKVVISDRYLDSSLAYQGHARGLGETEVRRINEWATAALEPDLTVLLRIDPATAGARAGEADRFEDEGLTLQQRVADAYDQLAAANPHRWKTVDAARSADEVAAEVLALVGDARAGLRAESADASRQSARPSGAPA
jgi:dTMP kinase